MNKFLKLLPILFLAAAIISCSDDEEDSALPLEGTLWTEISNATTGCGDPADNSSETSTCTSSDCSTVRLNSGTITFTDIEAGVTSTQTATYVVDGNTLKVTLSDSGFSFTFDFTYAINGNNLTISFNESDFFGSGTCVSTTTYSGS